MGWNANLDDLQLAGEGASRISKMPDLGKTEGGRSGGLDADTTDLSGVGIETGGDIHGKYGPFLLVDEIDDRSEIAAHIRGETRTQNGIDPGALVVHL